MFRAMNLFTKNSRVSRRRFLAAASATAALPTFVPLSAWGSDERAAPSARINMGMVGCGGMGNGNTDSFLKHANCQIVAACDVDQHHLEAMAKNTKRIFTGRNRWPEPSPNNNRS